MSEETRLIEKYADKITDNFGNLQDKLGKKLDALEPYVVDGAMEVVGKTQMKGFMYGSLLLIVAGAILAFAVHLIKPCKDDDYDLVFPGVIVGFVGLFFLALSIGEFTKGIYPLATILGY